jgi:N-acetylmuramoyl-L-alanine amidase
VTLDLIPAPSPNCNERKRPIGHVVLHYTGMEDGPAALARMCDPAAQVSAHYMVETDGRIFQLVPERQRAWHAGVSSWRGERDMNSASIGIEIVNGGHDFGMPDYPDIQIGSVVALVADVLQRNGLSASCVIGHSDIAPDRKQDPGEHFDWDALAQNGCALSPAAVDDGGVETEEELVGLLRRVGYGAGYLQADVVAAFQRRFRRTGVDGVIDAETASLIRRVVSSLG